MTTITKERLMAIKQWRETYGPGSNVVLPAEEAEELARIALASLEAKPIGAFHIAEQQVDGTSDYLKDGEWPIDNGIIEVYAAPPVLVVPEEKPMPNPLSMYAVDAVAAIAEVRGWNACRAAMLQGVEPVSNHDELALYYLQGQKDGLEWAAQLAEANHPHTGDWLYDDPLELAKAIRKGPDMPEFAGSSPVTQDGWISCSERMPDKGQRVLVCVDFDSSTVTPLVKDAEYTGSTFRIGHNTINTTGETSVTHWMPLPAPPQQ
ncbi:DUF551 domain-containing protein [Salmonella enterica subsp. enterica serovar Newport str. Levine 1]